MPKNPYNLKLDKITKKSLKDLLIEVPKNRKKRMSIIKKKEKIKKVFSKFASDLLEICNNIAIYSQDSIKQNKHNNKKEQWKYSNFDNFTPQLRTLSAAILLAVKSELLAIHWVPDSNVKCNEFSIQIGNL